MAVYLVDYENVNTTLFAAKKNGLNKGDKIVFFYSPQAAAIAIETLADIQRLGISATFIKTIVGTSNALDFQLVSYLGFLIRKDKDRRYHIVSHDNGYRCVCEFWKQYDVNVDLIEQIGSEGTQKTGKKPKAKKKRKKKKGKQAAGQYTAPAQEQFQQALAACIQDDADLQETVAALSQMATRMQMNMYITKHFDNEQVKKINKAIKPLIKGLPGN